MTTLTSLDIAQLHVAQPKMTMVRERDRIREVTAKLKKRYETPTTLTYPAGQERAVGSPIWAADVIKQLELLDLETCTAEMVDNIIGNDSWTRVLCTWCHQRVEVAIHVSPAPLDSTYYSSATMACSKCVQQLFEIWETKS